jgi:hypothetical protein
MVQLLALASLVTEARALRSRIVTVSPGRAVKTIWPLRCGGS